MTDVPHNHAEPCGHAGTDGERRIAWTNALLLLGVTVFLLWAAWTGRVGRCVAPRYVWMTPFGALFVAAMALAKMLRVREAHSSEQSACDSDHGHSGSCCGHAHSMVSMPAWRRGIHRGIICLPFALAWVVDPAKLSTEGLRKRQAPARTHIGARAAARRLDAAFQWVFDLGSSATAAQSDPASGPGGESDLDLSQATVRDVVNWSDNGREAELEGRFVSLIGQADRLPGESERAFDLMRVVVICCIADAVTVSLKALPMLGDRVTPGTWLRVGGIIQYEDMDGMPVPVLKASTPVELVPEPDYPYL
ncbi:MAG: DUF1980 domain-containing protein [Lentisphaerae bacterium]|nr:DUF1980 domain-containing protein [Lentisphaerota bacterium]MBT4819250.1 DUF1980 domain-containing protein [Lentisphaerota bacterium]MBT5610221.1 DUF1980 domain-containing protein [Lentisphaerota bacterium]MBT7060041.1 DUF1980 domain-containing protein [Lentisphaerota bacterium]MBT7840629.1 DUF1980 domain-containing protein [Lentisphaerota bacterium]